MSRYFSRADLSWTRAIVPGGTEMDQSVIWEGGLGVGSAFYHMPKGMSIPEHTHPMWVQVTVLEGEMEVESEADGTVRIAAPGCYFVEPGDTHTELATKDALILVTHAAERPSGLGRDEA